MDAEMKDLLIDYVDGNLTGELKEFVEKQLAKDEAVQQEYHRLQELSHLMHSDPQFEPDSTLRDDFLLAIEEELENVEMAPGKNKVKFMPWNSSWKVAAAIALLVASVFVGKWAWQRNVEDNALMALKKEMEATKNLVLASLQDKASASQRLKGVNAAFQVDDLDAEVIRVLIKTMNDDENVNVRLAAVQALSKFTDRPEVKEGLIRALEQQKEPLVQIALINLMVELREQRAIKKLEQIIEDEATLETVKDEAHMAVFKLS